MCVVTHLSREGRGCTLVCTPVFLWCVCGYTPVSGREGLYTGMFTCSLVVCVWLHTCLGKGGIVHWYVQVFSCRVCGYTPVSGRGRGAGLYTGMYNCSLVVCVVTHLSREGGVCVGGGGAVHWYVHLFSCGVCGYTPVSGREGLYTGMYTCSLVVSVVTHLSWEGRDCTLVCKELTFTLGSFCIQTQSPCLKSSLCFFVCLPACRMICLFA